MFEQWSRVIEALYGQAVLYLRSRSLHSWGGLHHLDGRGSRRPSLGIHRTLTTRRLDKETEFKIPDQLNGGCSTSYGPKLLPGGSFETKISHNQPKSLSHFQAVWLLSTHLCSTVGQHTESKQHDGDADEQLKDQEDHQCAQDAIDQELMGPNGREAEKDSSSGIFNVAKYKIQEIFFPFGEKG